MRTQVPMRDSFKKNLYGLSYRTGLPTRIGPFGRDKIIVLMYHGITGDGYRGRLRNIEGYGVTRENFARQMRYLARHCNVVSVANAVVGRNISRRKKNVILTFDDGYRNNYTNAFPLLLKYGFPALLSIPTAFVAERTPMWPDLLEYAVRRTEVDKALFSWGGEAFPYNGSQAPRKKELLFWLIERAIKVEQEERDAFLAHVLDEMGDVAVEPELLFRDPDYEPLRGEEIREMVGTGLVKLASHSVHHFLLSNTRLGVLQDEIIRSKAVLEEISGQACRYFCLPGGYYNDTVLTAIMEAGFERIFTSDPVEIDRDRIPEVIGRHCVFRHTSLPAFADMVQGPLVRLRGLLAHQ